MKLKLRYFIRGLGIGIVFTAIVMSLSLQASRSRIIRENALTKEEIMEKAMGYGMILDSSEDTNEQQKENDDKDVDDASSVKDKAELDEESLENKESSEQQTDEKEEDTKEEVAEDPSEKDDTSKNDDSIVSIDFIPIKITSGMTASAVGNLLREKKVIEDADEFQKYMSEQGYSSRIRVGEYLIPMDATYKKIVEIITKRK